MKTILVLAVVVVVAHAASLQEQWQEFKLTHGKTYKSLIEERRRFAVFQDNLRTIEENNKKFENGEISYKFGVNQFADLTSEEFQATLSPMPAKAKSNEVYTDTTVSLTSIDWVKEGLVTSVKDQGTCGSCWAFSTVGAVEALFKKNGSALESLSPQNLVDCDRSYNEGCNGGLMDYAFEYIKNHGICTEEKYPYKGRDGFCLKKCADKKIAGHVDVANNEESILSALSTVGPISAAIDATSMQLYESGILDSSGCTSNVNHGVLLVGSGSELFKNYWVIKNSWGTSWGEKGYFKLVRGKKACGISTNVSYPKL